MGSNHISTMSANKAVLLPRQFLETVKGRQDKEHAMLREIDNSTFQANEPFALHLEGNRRCNIA